MNEPPHLQSRPLRITVGSGQKTKAEPVAGYRVIIGRLLIFTRQMDMLMTSEKSVVWVAENFLAGNYELNPLGEAAV